MAENDGMRSKLQEDKNRDSEKIAYFWSRPLGRWIALGAVALTVVFIGYSVLESLLGWNV